LIDNHYYAIANKASLSKPKELNPPEDKQEEFNKLFGFTWKKALDDGLVYNAMDACKKLGIDGNELNVEWAKTKKSKQLIKFGGGFYCGKIPSGKDFIYVINGFYMSMREKYTKKGTSIYYYCVEWDSSKLSWANFRGKVLGATDPGVAEKDSLRSIILKEYKELGLTSEPNVGDNGVHASASPFEALCERLNWLEGKVNEDEFGKALLSAGIKQDTIMAWTKDPQVELEGKKVSLFDSLEDINADECIAAAKKITSGVGAIKNQAFVFIKPHAVTDQVKKLVTERFKNLGFSITKEGVLDAATIEEKKLIDNHYYAIANKASLSKPKELNPPEDKQEEFNKLFGFTWKKALDDGLVYNAMDACKKLGIDGNELNVEWAKTKKSKQLIKFGGGFYCGKIPSGKDFIYVINGFYMSMREKYTKKGTSIYYYCVEWDSSKLSWANFRGKVLGATDPGVAEKDSLRSIILKEYKELGLTSEPNVGDNGVHASASPFEALCERLNWLEGKVNEDEFGKALLSAGIKQDTIMAWTKDPQVELEGKKVSLFDSLEDINADECIAKVQAIVGSKKVSAKVKKTKTTLPKKAKKAPAKKANKAKKVNADESIAKAKIIAAEEVTTTATVSESDVKKILDQNDSRLKELEKIKTKLECEILVHTLEKNRKQLDELEVKSQKLEQKLGPQKLEQKLGPQNTQSVDNDQLLKSVSEKLSNNLTQLDKLMTIHNKIEKSLKQKPQKPQKLRKQQAQQQEGKSIDVKNQRKQSQQEGKYSDVKNQKKQRQQQEGKNSDGKYESLKERQLNILQSLDKLEGEVTNYLYEKQAGNLAKLGQLEELMVQMQSKK